MKNLKYLFLTLLGALAFVACTEDTREADWSGIQGNGVYFAVDSQTSYLLEENQSSLQIPVERTFTEGDLTVNVQLSDESELFAADSKARFADGKTTGYVEIVFDFKALEVGVAYEMTLSLLDKNQMSGYGLEDLTFSVKYDPWKTVGTALWRDDLLSLLYDGIGFNETEVELQQSLANENLYRLIDVYSPDFVATILGAAPSQVAGACSSHAIVFDVTNPNQVYIMPSSIGFDGGYGVMSVASLAYEAGFDVDEGFYGTMVDNVITFPASSLVMYLPSQGGWYYANPNGMTRIVMPGGVATDPQVAVTYKGYMTDPESNTNAVFDVTMNADAGSFRWAMSNEIQTQDDLNAFVAAIQDGSVNYQEGKEDGEYRGTMDDAGLFYAVFVPYSTDGSIVGKPTVVTFEYTAGGVTPAQFAVEFTVDAQETEVDIALTPNAKNLAYYWDFVDKATYDLIADKYGSIDAYMAAYFDSVAQEYGITVADVLAVYGTKGAVEEMYYEQLKPGTEYVVYAYCYNTETGAARSEISEYVFTTLTPAEFAADYEAWIGTWTVQPTAYESGDAAPSFDITVKMKKSNAMYYVTGWGDGTTLPTFPVTMVYQANEDGTSLVYIPEQITNGQIQVSGEITSVAFLARFFYEPQGAYYCYGGGAVAIVGGLTADGAQMVPYVHEDKDLGEIELSGADYFCLFADGGITAEVSKFAVGPYTLTKKAEEPTTQSVCVEMKTVKMTQEGQTKQMRAQAARALHNAKYNCVMVR